ncbi:hypothetical protein Hanom_Chr04g00294841 [Helianthus anomalus]
MFGRAAYPEFCYNLDANNRSADCCNIPKFTNLMKRVYEVFGVHQTSSVDLRRRCDLTEITSSRVWLSLFEMILYSFGDNLHEWIMRGQSVMLEFLKTIAMRQGCLGQKEKREKERRRLDEGRGGDSCLWLPVVIPGNLKSILYGLLCAWGLN